MFLRQQGMADNGDPDKPGQILVFTASPNVVGRHGADKRRLHRNASPIQFIVQTDKYLHHVSRGLNGK